MTDSSALDRFASHGLSGFTGNELASLTRELYGRCLDSGDARYCVLASMLNDVVVWFIDENYEQVPVELYNQISAELASQLPDILHASQSDAAKLADSLKSRIRDMCLPPERWDSFA